jgi:hypothetical protein
MPSYESSMRNLQRARAHWRRPRPWRSELESKAIRRFVLEWVSFRPECRPPGRAWARMLGISHTWLQKLAREFRNDRKTAYLMNRFSWRMPHAHALLCGRGETNRMRRAGLLRSTSKVTF